MTATGDGVVLFDLDGVLADSRAAITGCLNAALVASGRPARPAEELYRCIGPPLPYAFAELIGEDPDSEPVTALVVAYRERYATASLTDTVVTPGIAEVLAELAQRRPVGVATSKPRAFAEPLLEALGLREHVAVVAGPELGTALEDKKTTVGVALRALRATGGAMIGDTVFDMVAAHAHGLRAIGVTWGIGTAEELRAAGADVLVDEPAQIPAALSPPQARP